MAQFEKPVSVAAFPDYTQRIRNPMDLQTVERKVKNGVYSTPEDFEYDLMLIFQNCILYNTSRSVDHLVNLGKYGTKQFRRIFAAKIKIFDDPSTTPAPRDIERRSPPPGAEHAPSKRLKLDTSGPLKLAPRISLSSAQLSLAAERNTPRPKSSRPKAKGNQPVPLHIAISQVKEKFPLRRNVKSLQPWEAGCARFFKGKLFGFALSRRTGIVKVPYFYSVPKELMRHSWISAAHPKFIFHVPVPVLFPVSVVFLGSNIETIEMTSDLCHLLSAIARGLCRQD
jgi:hypothetical protein